MDYDEGYKAGLTLNALGLSVVDLIVEGQPCCSVGTQQKGKREYLGEKDCRSKRAGTGRGIKNPAHQPGKQHSCYR